MSGLLASLLMIAGCSVTPVYEKPAAAVPTAFKSAPLPVQEAGTWKTAQPAEAVARGDWWTVFGDSTLNDLEAQARDANQNLKAAAARLEQARALQRTARSALFPTLDAGFGPTRERVSPASLGLSPGANVAQTTLWRAQASASYEVDLFGRVSASVQAAQADTQRSEALLRSVLLAVQADVAQNYFNLRELDAEADVFARTVAGRENALRLMQRRYAEGDIGELDVARARSELATARADSITVARSRAASEDSLAVLLGKSPSEFKMTPQPLTSVAVQIPAGLPSALLERRPDIAAAEREMAAANARVGVAKSAFFPSLSLTGAGGFEAGTLGNLFQWSSRTFLLGPLVGTALSLPIFDGGARRGNLANARAQYEEDVATYRQQVLVAFQEVEDHLSDLQLLNTQLAAQNDAVQASSRAAQLSRLQYKEGQTSYLDVIEAERTVFETQRVAAQLTGAQAVSTVNLIRALGGGWGNSPAVSSNEPAAAAGSSRDAVVAAK
ncbi:MAG: efflux transporter outer membrane subunit [Janthinobacterium lividum]